MNWTNWEVFNRLVEISQRGWMIFNWCHETSYIVPIKRLYILLIAFSAIPLSESVGHIHKNLKWSTHQFKTKVNHATEYVIPACRPWILIVTNMHKMTPQFTLQQNKNCIPQHCLRSFHWNGYWDCFKNNIPIGYIDQSGASSEITSCSVVSLK